MPKTPVTTASPFIKAIFNHAVENNILLLNSDGIILTVNKAFCTSFGYAPQDLRGKHLAVLFTPEDREKGLPGRELKNVLLTGQGSDNNYLLAKDNTAIWVSGESVLAQKEDGKRIVVKMIQDIHVQKESEISLKNLYELNEDILKSIRDAVVVLNEDLQIIKTNDAFLHLFKTIQPAAEQMDFALLVAPFKDNGDLLANIRHTLSSGKSFQRSTMGVQLPANGEEKLFEISGTSMQLTASSRNILLVWHDITYQKQLDIAREDIIGFVAHEVRNPLANLGLCNDVIDLLLKADRPGEIPDMLQRSRNNIKRLNRMIAELYKATKVSSGSIELDIAPYHFDEMIRESVETVKGLTPDFTITIAQNPDIVVQGDKYRMIEVVTNYLSNGIKYANGSTSLLLSAEKDGQFIRLSVKDHGPGIPAGQLPFIFERFYRAEKTKHLEGLGLGLYLCKRIIQAHRGKVWVESEEGKGSTFYFMVPVS
jgi:PAS domain S-box-containing protein